MSIFTDAEKEENRAAKGATPQEQADAKLYMSNSAYRAQIDASDKEKGQSKGAKYRAIFYGRQPDANAVTVKVSGPSEVEVAAAITKYPKAKCKELFAALEGSTAPTSSSLSKDDYRVAKIAATFFGILQASDAGPSVSFAYQTKRDRQLKRDAAAEQKSAPGLSADGLPPGLQRSSDGIGFSLVDPAAFTAWKQSQEASKQAKATIAAALEGEEQAAA